MSPVDTLIASATVARTDGRTSSRAGQLFQDLTIGQNLKLRVLRQLDQGRYEVSFGQRIHVVESRIPLKTGARFEARVESKDERLELRYLAQETRFEDQRASGEEIATAVVDSDANPLPWIAELAKELRVPIGATALATIQEMASRSEEPRVMAQAGLFLQKLAQRVSAEDLAILYRTLSDELPMTTPQAPVDLESMADPVVAGDALADRLDAAVEDPTGSQTSGEHRDDARRALRLLNRQDEGSVVWRYGTFPILVGGQLVELDLVMFRERQPSAAHGGLRRLVMTLETTHFGRVRVEARALEDRILVRLQASTADAVETLSGYGADVRAAIERLGWQVDEVTYDIEPHGPRAAQAVIDHVLSAGSVDREL